MDNEKETSASTENKPKIGKYVFCFLLFVALYLFLPALFAFVNTILNIFTPKFFKMGQDGILLFGYIFSAFFSVIFIQGIMGDDSMYPAVLAIIGGAYGVFVATWNYLVGKIDGFNALCVATQAVCYLGIAIYMLVKRKKGKESKTGQ